MADRLSALEYRMAAKKGWDPELSQAAEETALELRAHLDALPEGTKESLGKVHEVVGRYEQAVRVLFALYRNDDLTEAEEWDEEHVDKTYDEMIAVLAEAGRESAEQAATWDRWAHVGILVTLIATAVLSSILFFRFDKARRVAVWLEAEQRTLGESERRLKALIQNASDVFAILDAEGRFRYLSTACGRVMGYTPEALLSTAAMSIVHAEDQSRVQELLRRAAATPGENTSAELRLKQGDGSWADYEVIACDLLNVPAVNGVVTTYRNITERKAAAQELSRLAFQDVLTGLPNRALFMHRLARALTQAGGRPDSVAILFIDLDNFKQINDSLGHEMGDRLLVAVTERLRKVLPPPYVLARLGGDEFTVLLEETSLSAALLLAEQLRMQLVPPFHIQGEELFVSASIGVAGNDPGENRAEALLQNADLAMYQAKRLGKDRQVAFDLGMREQVDHRLAMENDLRRAIERDELRLYYQPIVHLSTGAMIGVEALMRWEHPVHGLILPGEFIPVAEETGLIVELGRWALTEGCRQLRQWQNQSPDQAPLRLSVNLSAVQLHHPNLVTEVTQALQESGLDPRSLELELTESALMHDLNLSVAVLRELHALGVRTAIDDFGTGYSSLAYLQRFPLNTLKIDRSFTNLAGSDPKIMAIVAAVVQLGRDLGLDVVCEGIEEAAQIAYLKGLGCPLGQGYHFARPLPPVACGELLQAGALIPGRLT